jgi:hypothetical protein
LPCRLSLADKSRRNFDLFYFLRNPNDTTTYCIQANIYDVRTGAGLSTVPPTQSAYNPHLFITTLQAPADSVGLGRNMVAVASLYTDSGHTTNSPEYDEQQQCFLIKAVPPVYEKHNVIVARS